MDCLVDVFLSSTYCVQWRPEVEGTESVVSYCFRASMIGARMEIILFPYLLNVEIPLRIR
jgi:hypothetical protein